MTTSPTPPRAVIAVGDDAGYARVNGLEMYYETHGTGMPLVLLPGAFMTVELTS